MSLVDRVRRTIRRRNLVPPGARVVAAISGGPDSVALAHLLHALDRQGELRLVALAHLNHRLRPEAERDEAHCRSIAEALGLPLVVERIDVRARAAETGRSIEAAAHDIRHAFFERARLAHHADATALGHTMDDQAETFLLRLIRGAGPRGLGAMHPKRGAVVRPLIDCRRSELRAFLDADHIGYVCDQSNEDVRIPRNRVRTELLPLLEHRFNPRIVDALSRAAELARADEASLEAQAADYWRRHAAAHPLGWSLDAGDLASRPVALQRRVVLHGMAVVAPGRPVGFEHVERAVALLTPSSAAVDLPGQRWERHGRFVVLRSRSAGRPPSPRDAAPQFRHVLRIPGDTPISEAGCVVTAELLGGASPDVLGLTPDRAAVVPAALVASGGMAVRGRRPGDRVRPGPGGSRKLQDVLVDRKVPRQDRDRIPLVVDRDDRIVWVAGHVQAQEFRVTDPAQAVVVLRLKGVGGSC
ncbi:MAG: tRNA lysidine(34) synthetase TilS [Vicinamibacterales bacterium]